MDFGPAYAKELAALLDQPGFELFHETIRKMLQHRKRVEQESVHFRCR